MKKFLYILMALLLVLCFASCQDRQEPDTEKEDPPAPEVNYQNAVKIELGKNVTVDGKPTEESGAVRVGGEIIYYKNIDKYESGNLYGEGEDFEKHTAEEAAEHTLVTITRPGEYIISGEMKGQLAVDLGEDAKTDPNARVTLIFSGADITCTVAPAVIFYNVYECGDAATPTEAPDTSAAGANVIIADESENNINGSYVARIYKDNNEGKKLHKYDGAFYSKMSMNIGGEKNGTGVLNITAENEGLDSEMHLTVNGGNIIINAQNDGINTNEDGISVTTINGGNVDIKGGLGFEGDGIDSNGWLVINGGTVIASGNGRNGDGGIDADMGILLNGGTVAAFGSRNDRVTPGENQTCVQFTFASIRKGGSTVKFIDEAGYGMVYEAEREFQSVVFAGENLEKNKEYRLYVNEIMQEYSGNEDSWGGRQPKPEGNAQPPKMQNQVPDMNNPFMLPEGFEEWLESDKDIPANIREWLESLKDEMKNFGSRGNFGTNQPQNPGMTVQQPERTEPQKESGGLLGLEPVNEDMTVFVITDKTWNFSGICDSSAATGKENVEFTVNGKEHMEDIYIGDLPDINSIECNYPVNKKDIQISLEYVGAGEEITVATHCFLSEGYGAVKQLFSGLSAGRYRMTVAVVAENTEYTGSTLFDFEVLD